MEKSTLKRFTSSMSLFDIILYLFIALTVAFQFSAKNNDTTVFPKHFGQIIEVVFTAFSFSI